jgi:general stress protein 26
MTEEQTFRNEILALIRACEGCVLATIGADGMPHLRAMSSNIEDDFEVWFATSASSRKMKDVAANPVAAVYYQKKDGWDNVVISGRAQEITDKSVKQKLWKDDWKQYWPDGPDSPDYGILQVATERVDYQDTTGMRTRTLKI